MLIAAPDTDVPIVITGNSRFAAHSSTPESKREPAKRRALRQETRLSWDGFDASTTRQCGPNGIVAGALGALAQDKRVSLAPSVVVADVDQCDRRAERAVQSNLADELDPGDCAPLACEPPRTGQRRDIG
jgi:hypothetical protein